MDHSHLTSNYMEHGFCFSWEPGLVWLHVASDIVTGIAYYSIPLAMFYFAFKRRDLLFLQMYLLFATFILACGTTHFLAAYTVYVPAYWQEGYVKAFTALISAVSAILFIPLIPKAIAMPSLAKALAENQQLNIQLNDKIHELQETSKTLELAHSELQLSEARFRATFEQAAAGVAIISTDGSYLAVNSKFCSILGFTTEELLSMKFQDVTYQEDLPGNMELYQKALAGQINNYTIEHRYICRNGQTVWVNKSVALVRDSASMPTYFIAVIEDISARKLIEEEKEHLIHQLQDKTTELERFIYTISHDLKSPLITISGFLGFLEADFAAQDSANFKSTISRISLASERMKQLLDELLELSRIGRKMNPPTWVNLGELIREALEVVSGRINEAKAVIEVEPNLPAVEVDRQRLLQVYENLIDNAVKFAAGSSPPRIWIGVRYENDEPVFFVRDNGIGINPAYLTKVFDLFEKLDQHSSGTGVGLAITHRIITIHGGRMWAESDGMNHGATFCFTLPTTEGGPIPCPEKP
jgi:PAS domain S-box-containing protein